MALAYGDAFRLEELSALELAYFAQRTGHAQSSPCTRTDAYGARDHARRGGSGAIKVYVGEERSLVGRIRDFVTVQAGKLMQLAPELPRIDPSLL